MRADMERMLTTPIQWAKQTGARNTAGELVHSAATTIYGLVSHKQKVVVDSRGEEKVSNIEVYLKASAIDIKEGDLVTPPYDGARSVLAREIYTDATINEVYVVVVRL